MPRRHARPQHTAATRRVRPPARPIPLGPDAKSTSTAAADPTSDTLLFDVAKHRNEATNEVLVDYTMR